MKNEVQINNVFASPHKGRREFLKISGLAAAGTGLFLAGCSDNEIAQEDILTADRTTPGAIGKLPGIRNGIFDLGGNDLGVLTFAYALEQLEAEFYTKVVTNPDFSTTFPIASEQQLMRDLYNHEVIHREFFRTALTGALPNPTRQLLPNLSFDFSSVNFSDRATVLTISKTLEDTGVGAYNGAGQYLKNATYLTLAGKIVSVEARHASAIRSLLNPDASDSNGNFAGNDVVDPSTGLDVAMMPSAVLAAVTATGFITTPFTAQYLP